MRAIRMAMAVAVFAAVLPALAKDPEAQFKSLEAKHFARAEGVELSPEFADYLFGQVIGEGEVVDAADAPASIIIEGNITEYKKGSAVKDRLIGFGAGWRSLKLDTTVKRRSDQSIMVSPQIHVRSSPRWKDKVLAKEAAHQIVKELKEALKEKGAAK